MAAGKIATLTEAKNIGGSGFIVVADRKRLVTIGDLGTYGCKQIAFNMSDTSNKCERLDNIQAKTTTSTTYSFTLNLGRTLSSGSWGVLSQSTSYDTSTTMMLLFSQIIEPITQVTISIKSGKITYANNTSQTVTLVDVTAYLHYLSGSSQQTTVLGSFVIPHQSETVNLK